MNDTRWWDVIAKLTPLIIGLGVTGLGSYAANALKEREYQLTKLKALNEFRPLLESNKESERAFAYSAFVELGYGALAVTLVKAANDPAGRPALAAVAQGKSEELKTTAEQALATVPVYVFLQTANKSQKPAAQQLGSEISRNLHYLFEGTENIEDKAVSPANTEVRFFNKSDEDAARKVAGLLIERGLPEASPKLVTVVKAKPGTIEVWFSNKTLQLATPASDGHGG
jgi:hypothetical protein